MTKLALALGFLLTLVGGCATRAPEPVAPRETIVFLGNSITARGVKPWGYVSLTAGVLERAYPGMGIAVVGAGVSGNKVPDCQRRLERDVLQRQPALVVIYIGTNDVLHWLDGKGTPIEDYEAGLEDLVTRTRAAGAAVILCTPGVLGEKTDGTNHFDRMLDDYAEVGRRVARESGAQLLDLRRAFMAYLKVHNTANADTGVLTSDGVHLNQDGDDLLAALVLDALNVPDGLHDLGR
jgi:lysophospholipase L1-like esterase